MSDKPQQPSVALIGFGYWGKNLARNFRTLKALHTICDTRQPVLDALGPEYVEIRKTVCYDDILQNPEIRQVAIAAPAALHYLLAKQALEAGKDVFVEKPLCLEIQQAEELVALAQGFNRILMVGHLLQYHPCVQKIQELLVQGELGKLQYITSNRLNLGKIRREENALWSFAPHDISVILSLAGGQLPEQVRCTGEAYLTEGVPDTTLTALRFAAGVRAHIYVSWLNPFKEQKLTVVGSEGMIVFDDTRPWPQKLILHRHYLTWAHGQVPTPSKSVGEPVVVAEAEPLQAECEHFLACCRDRKTSRTNGEEGLRVLQVLHAAQTSLKADGKASRPTPGGPREYFAHPTAVVDDGASIGEGTKIWHFSHIMRGAKIGEHCVLGQNVNVADGVIIGNNVKIQNNVSIYSGLVIEDDVFLGPSCVLTNVVNPRSQINRQARYEKTTLGRGATVGANATIVCGVSLGCYSFIGAGAVVTKDVPDYALMVGNPARQQSWMSRHGHALKAGADGLMICPESGFRYREVAPNVVRCLDLRENEPLPVGAVLPPVPQ